MRLRREKMVISMTLFSNYRFNVYSSQISALFLIIPEVNYLVNYPYPGFPLF